MRQEQCGPRDIPCSAPRREIETPSDESKDGPAAESGRMQVASLSLPPSPSPCFLETNRPDPPNDSRSSRSDYQAYPGGTRG